MNTEKKKGGIIKGMKSEFKKVSWPKKEEIINSAIVVVAALIGVSVIIKLLDTVFRFLLSFTL